MRKAVEMLAAAAGRMMLEQRAASVTKKQGHANFVTDIDASIQQFLMDRLALICPEAVFIGEEKENAPLTDQLTWVIDPIDGTTNFIHEYQCSAVSIALLKDMQPVIGVICNPYLQEVFSAEKNKGAALNGNAMHVSSQTPENALVGFGTSPYNPELNQPSMALASQFLATCVDIRRSGSAALDLAHIACGRLDIFFELILKPWDVSAGALLIQEAGGIFDMPLLPEISFAKETTILATNRECYEYAKTKLLNILK